MAGHQPIILQLRIKDADGRGHKNNIIDVSVISKLYIKLFTFNLHAFALGWAVEVKKCRHAYDRPRL
jgi:hypothetical protein